MKTAEELGMPDKVRQAIYKVLLHIKMARRSDPALAKAILLGDDFKNKSIKLLEEIIGWDDEDEKVANLAAQELLKKTAGDKFSERSHKVSKFIWGGGLVALFAAGIAGGIAYYKEKKNGEKNGTAEK